MICYLGLGSNLGDRKDYINRAITRFAAIDSIKLLKCSSIIETEPFGRQDQPEFLNCVLKISTSLSPEELLKICQETEISLGRIHRELWGPRTIDIDILFYGKRIVDLPHLVIPHPGITVRKFILTSLMELCPDFIHPITHRSIRQMYQFIS
jgi:2-amino-4-hydroxy-6-hydroxymethyldihydropteridine diphosphokinase